MDLYHVSFPGLGINDLPVNRIAFSFELGGREINIYWYGIIIALAFLTCIILASRQAPKFGIKSDDIVDTFLWVIILGLVGARLYYVAFSWENFSGDLLKIFHTRDGGLAFYGGVIGGALGIFIAAKMKKINFIYFLDFFSVYLPLGQAIGRWGNFFNQEAFGTNTMLPWGMFSEGTYQYLSHLGEGYAPLTPVHPTFLYESIANIIIFIILIRVRAKSFHTGKVTGLYFVLYGAVRFFVEGLRTDSLYIGQTSIRISQALSFVFVLLGVLLIILAKRDTFAEHVSVLAQNSENLPNDLQDEVKESDNTNFNQLSDADSRAGESAQKAAASAENMQIKQAETTKTVSKIDVVQTAGQMVDVEESAEQTAEQISENER